VGDAQWVDPVAELPVGGTTGQVLEKQSAADGDVVWNDLPVITHPIDAHDPTATYAANDLVIEAGKIYRANGAVGPKTFTPADWDEIGAPPPVTAHGVKLYDAASTYTALDLVAKDGELYRAKVNVPAEAFDITKWDHIDAGAHEVLVHWEATQDYSSDDLVFLGGHVYKAINAVPAGPFDPTKWDMMESGIGGQYMMLPPLATDGDDWDFVFVQLDPAAYTAGDGFYAKLPGGWQPIDISKVLPNELPAAGTPGQVLAKKTAADGDVEWIGPVVHPIDAFDATAAYAQGDIVIESGKLYSALGAVTAGAFDPTEWDHIGRRTLAGKAIEPQPAVTLADDGDLIYVPEHSDAAVWTKGGSPGVYVNSVNSGYKLSFTELMGAPTVSLGGLGGKLGPGEFTHTGLTVTEEGGTAQTLAITGVAGSAWGWAKSNPTFTPAELAFFNDLKDHNIDSIHCDLPNLNITSGLISGYMYFKANGVWNTIYIKNSEQPTPGTLVLRDGNGGVAANIITCTESRNSGDGRISGDLIVQGDLTEQGHKFLRQFEQNKNYVAGDPILWNNWIYTANGAVAAGSTWAAADWTKYGTISDEALKENVRDEGDALPIINQLRPVTFEWGEKHGGADPGTRRGFIAQEVEKVLPDVIFDSAMNGEGIYKGVEYLELISLQTKAIQELSAQVEELKKEVAALKGA